MFQLGGTSLSALIIKLVPLKKSVVCLQVKYAHGAIVSCLHSSMKKACYAMCRCIETTKYACVYVCVCRCVRNLEVLIQFLILLRYSSIHLESCEIQVDASVLC